MQHYDYIDTYYPSYWHIPNDTEAAMVVPPGHDCCPDSASGDECQCITTGDILRWDYAYNNLTALSSINWSAINSLSSYINELSGIDNWNWTYGTVLKNYKSWNKISALDDLIESGYYWNNTYSTVKTYSANWNSAANAATAIAQNTQNIERLSADFSRQVKIYFSPDSITGTGTQNDPYGVRNYGSIISTLNILNNGYNLLFPNGQQGWISLTADSDIDGINPYQKALFSAVAVKDTDQDKALMKHGELIEWLIKNLNEAQNGINTVEQWITNEGVMWRHVAQPNVKSDIVNYTARNTVYFSFDND